MLANFDRFTDETFSVSYDKESQEFMIISPKGCIAVCSSMVDAQTIWLALEFATAHAKIRKLGL